MKVPHEVRSGAILNRVAALLGLFLALSPHLVASQQVLIVRAPDGVAGSDTGFPHRDCKSVEEPIGFVTGTGVVGYWLARDGRADTSTVRVMEVTGISAAGYRSAVVRLLSGCRVSVPRGFPREGKAVAQRIRLAGSAFQPFPATELDSLPAVLPAPPVLIPTTGLPLADDDERLEERPAPIPGCLRRMAPLPPGGSYSSIEEAKRDLDRWVANNRGRIRISVEVGTDGRAVPGTATILESDNRSAANALLSSMQRCRYAPGRIGGRPVPSTIVLVQGQS